MMHPAIAQTLAVVRAEELRRTTRPEAATPLRGEHHDRAPDDGGRQHRIRRTSTRPLGPRETSPLTTRHQAPRV
jgi:hypothetical protein